MSENLVEVRDLVKHFPLTRGIVFQRQIGAVHAVDGISFDVRPGETLGIVGETGCGKSTTARLMLRLLDATSGTISFEGEDITDVQRVAAQGAAARDADDLPGPLLVAEPAQDRRRRSSASRSRSTASIEGEGERKRAVQELMEQVGPATRSTTTASRTSSPAASASASAWPGRSR